MGYAAGATIPGSTTLNTFIDACLANKSAGLTAASATITALDPSYFKVAWPGIDAGHSLVYIRISPRGVPPSSIAF